MNKKKVIIAVIIFAVVAVNAAIFLIAGKTDTKKEPAAESEPEAMQEQQTAEAQEQAEEQPKEYNKKLQGVYGTKNEAGVTTFYYFDSETKIFFCEEYRSDAPKIRYQGYYAVKDDVLLMSGKEYSFARSGEDIIIDGVLYLYCPDIIIA